MKPPHTYLLYGFNVKSDIEMPAVPGNAAQAGDLFFRLLPPTTKQPTTIGSNWLIESAAGQTSLTIRDVGTYRIRNGSEVYVEPVPGVENSRLRIYLMASVLGLLLDQFVARMLSHVRRDLNVRELEAETIKQSSLRAWKVIHLKLKRR